MTQVHRGNVSCNLDLQILGKQYVGFWATLKQITESIRKVNVNYVSNFNDIQLIIGLYALNK